MLQAQSETMPQPGPTVTKAVIRAAALLRLNQTVLAETLGVSRATASRLHSGGYVLDPARRKEWELALLFVRLFRSLDAILGHGEAAHRWLEGQNITLNGRPVDLIRTTEGLIRVIHALDATRGRL